MKGIVGAEKALRGNSTLTVCLIAISCEHHDLERLRRERIKERRARKRKTRKVILKTRTGIAQAYDVLTTAASVRRSITIECILVVVKEETKRDTHNSPAITRDGLSE